MGSCLGWCFSQEGAGDQHAVVLPHPSRDRATGPRWGKLSGGGRGASRPGAIPHPDLRRPCGLLQLVPWQGLRVSGQLWPGCVWSLGSGSFFTSLVAQPEQVSRPVCHLQDTRKILVATTQPAARSPGRGKARTPRALRSGRGQDPQPRSTKGPQGVQAKLRDVPGLRAPRAEAPAVM